MRSEQYILVALLGFIPTYGMAKTITFECQGDRLIIYKHGRPTDSKDDESRFLFYVSSNNVTMASSVTGSVDLKAEDILILRDKISWTAKWNFPVAVEIERINRITGEFSSKIWVREKGHLTLNFIMRGRCKRSIP